MKLNMLLQGVEVLELHADGDMDVRDVSYDSRRVEPGNLFVAISGFETDGYKYIGSAIEKGAAVILCERRPEQDVPYVLVQDARKALALTSCNYFGRPGDTMTVIGVTGTNGKTTSTMLIKHLLETQLGAKVGLIGTNQNMIGDTVVPTERTTPESYELQKLLRDMADSGCTHAVMEVSSHSLVLSRVAGLHFAVGLFTNLTQDHLDFHKTMDAYAEAKALLFSHCEKGGVNLDDAYADVMLQNAKCPIFTWSAEKNEADLVAKDIRLAAGGIRFCALAGEKLERVKLGIPGRFSVYNAMTVITCGLLLGIELEKCCAALTDAQGVKGRVEVVPGTEDYTILIDYAHTPDALENVLRSMREVTDGRLVALFGCGGDRDRTKRPIMGRIGTENADFCIITSDNPRTEVPEAIIEDILAGVKCPKNRYKVITDRREAIAWAMKNHQSGDVLLLCGKGHETYQIIGKEKFHMDEREIVAENLAG